MTACSKPSTPHQRACAKGKSSEMVITTVSSRSDKALLKVRVCTEQIPVSIDGTTLITFFLPAQSAKPSCDNSLVLQEKSGAPSPTCTLLPTNVTFSPRNVVMRYLLYAYSEIDAFRNAFHLNRFLRTLTHTPIVTNFERFH